MADIHLHFITLRLSLTKLFADLEEALLYFSLDPRLQLLLHVVEFEVLAFEVFEWVAFLLCITPLHILHDGLFAV